MSFFKEIDKLFLILGRLAYALPFLGFGINQFVKTKKYELILPSYVPWPQLWVYLTGVVFIITSLSILINFKARTASLVLALVLLVFVFLLFVSDIGHNKTYIATYSTFIGGALLIFVTSKNKI